MKIIQTIIFAVLTLVCFTGCSSETTIATSFVLQKGSEITFETAIKTSNRDSTLFFELENSTTRKNRDYSDTIQVELIDSTGKAHKPAKIWDINGSNQDIAAECSNIPKGTTIKKVKITAIQDIKGRGIHWWTGHSK